MSEKGATLNPERCWRSLVNKGVSRGSGLWVALFSFTFFLFLGEVVCGWHLFLHLFLGGTFFFFFFLFPEKRRFDGTLALKSLPSVA